MKKFYILYLILIFLSIAAWGQTFSSVIIGEVLYDSPLSSDIFILEQHTGEFLSLYNYGEDSVNLGGWQVVVKCPINVFTSNNTYTIPINTMLPPFSLAVIAFRAKQDTFNVVTFYGSVNNGNNIVLYNNSLTLPDIKSQILILDANNVIQDRMIYDGISSQALGEQLLRAENRYGITGNKCVSIQRRNITTYYGEHVFNRQDYYLNSPKHAVRMFSFVPPDFSFVETPTDYFDSELSLSGISTGVQEHKSYSIQSTQVIESGKVTYVAEEEIVLNQGFEVKVGAEFETQMDDNQFNNLTIMTYNLGKDWQKADRYRKHAQVINSANADIVSLQEVRAHFGIIKDKTNLDGRLILAQTRLEITDIANDIFQFGGNALLWNKSKVGSPRIRTKYIRTPNFFIDRSYTIAEFYDFCVIVTHYPTNNNDGYQTAITNAILNEDIVKNYRKPVYIAGDMNFQPHDTIMPRFNNANFQLLNNTTKVNGTYIHPTTGDGKIIDMILEYNTNPKHKTLYRGIPNAASIDNVVDHYPYVVKVKLK